MSSINLTEKDLENFGISVPFPAPLTFIFVFRIFCLVDVSSGMFIPDPNFFHPGTEFFPSRIILTKKIVSNLSEVWFGLFIPDPDPDFLPIPDPGV